MAHALIPVLGSRRYLEEESVAKRMRLAATVLEPRQKSFEQQKSWNASQSVSKTVYASPYAEQSTEQLPRSPNRSSSHKQSHNRRRLTTEQREAAAVMRLIGACSGCKTRKTMCDPGMPCRSCLGLCREGVTLSCRGIVVEDSKRIHVSNDSLEIKHHLNRLDQYYGGSTVVPRASHLAETHRTYRCAVENCGIEYDSFAEHK